MNSAATPNQSPLPITADIHLHTSHSHGQAGTLEMFQAACDKGLTIIGFSEHSPRPRGYVYPTDYQDKLKSTFPQYVDEVRQMAGLGKTLGVTVLLGLEVDYIPGQEAYAETLSKAYPFDYIIGGLHFQDTWGFDYSADEWEAKSQEERFAAYARYYKDLAQMCQTGLFQVAAHPDLIKIFTVDDFRQWLDTKQAVPLIKNALTAMKEHGVLMEISSAGIRKPCQEIYPGHRIMELAAKMELPVSFASDAHCVNTPAYAFDQLARYASRFGFKHSHVVIKGEARQIPFTSPSLL